MKKSAFIVALTIGLSPSAFAEKLSDGGRTLGGTTTGYVTNAHADVLDASKKILNTAKKGLEPVANGAANPNAVKVIEQSWDLRQHVHQYRAALYDLGDRINRRVPADALPEVFGANATPRNRIIRNSVNANFVGRTQPRRVAQGVSIFEQMTGPTRYSPIASRDWWMERVKELKKQMKMRDLSNPASLERQLERANRMVAKTNGEITALAKRLVRHTGLVAAALMAANLYEASATQDTSHAVSTNRMKFTTDLPSAGTLAEGKSGPVSRAQ